jgi:hypothetical protein
MASLNVIRMITEETLVFQDNFQDVHKLYSATLFKCAEEGHNSHCTINT